MKTISYELTATSLYNQEWKCKMIVGYGAGIYVGDGVEAKYIAKANSNEIAIDQLLKLYQDICDRHNALIGAGQLMRERKKFFLLRWWRAIQIWFLPEYTYNYPDDLKEK